MLIERRLLRKISVVALLAIVSAKAFAQSNSFKQLTPPSEVLHAQYSADASVFLQTPLEVMVLGQKPGATVGGQPEVPVGSYPKTTAGGQPEVTAGAQLATAVDIQLATVESDYQKVFSYPLKNYTEYGGEVGFKSCRNFFAVSGEPAVDGVGAFHLFDRTGFQKLRTFKSTDVKEFSKLHSVQFHESCSLVFTYSEGPLEPRGKWFKQLRIFDIASGLILYARDFEETVDSIVISSDFKHIAVTRWGRTAVWPLNNSVPAYQFFDEAHSMLQLAFEQDSNHLVVLSNAGFTHHDITSNKLEATIVGPEQLDTRSLERIPSSLTKFLVRSYRTSNVFTYDVATKQFAKLATGLKKQVDVLCFTPSGSHLAVISGIDLAILDLATGAIKKTLKLDPVYPTLCTLSPTADKLIIGTAKHGAREYSLR